MNPYAQAFVAPYQDAVARTLREAIAAGGGARDVAEHLAFALAMEAARHLGAEDDPRALQQAADALTVAEHEIARLAAAVAAAKPAG
jgi:hypothetical protein